VKLYDPLRLQVRVDVPLAQAARLAPGQPAEATVDVLADRVFRGRVTRIVHEADAQKNTIQIKVAIDEPSGEIKPEMLTRVRVYVPSDSSATNTHQEGLLIPENMVSSVQGNETVVWIVNGSQQRAEPRTIRLGESRTGRWRHVADGLRPGDRVVIGPTDSFKPGQRVRVVSEERIDE
jgi:RND family efflux transporter MFP subunit